MWHGPGSVQAADENEVQQHIAEEGERSEMSLSGVESSVQNRMNRRFVDRFASSDCSVSPQNRINTVLNAQTTVH